MKIPRVLYFAIWQLWREGCKVSWLAQHFQVSETTIYRIVKVVEADYEAFCDS